MTQFIASIALIIPDYDQAIDFYVNKLGFDLLEDTQLTPDKRWVAIAPPGAKETRIILTQAYKPEQIVAVGNQAGGGVLMILKTDNFDRDYDAMGEKGVEFLEQPRSEIYGKVVVFKDPFGHKWDLLETSE